MAIVIKPKNGTKPTMVQNGIYSAKLSDIRQFQNAYGDRLGFEFTIKGGDCDGLSVMRSTTPNLTAKSKLAELLTGLLGRSLKDFELTGGMDIEDLIGTECQLLIMQSQGRNGQTYSNVEKVFT